MAHSISVGHHHFDRCSEPASLRKHWCHSTPFRQYWVSEYEYNVSNYVLKNGQVSPHHSPDSRATIDQWSARCCCAPARWFGSHSHWSWPYPGLADSQPLDCIAINIPHFLKYIIKYLFSQFLVCEGQWLSQPSALVFLPSLDSAELDPFHIRGFYISCHSQRWALQVYENLMLIGWTANNQGQWGAVRQ